MSGAVLCLLALAQAAATAPAVATPLPQPIAPGIELLRGAILPGRGPDGNTAVLDAPEGLIVVDTGRHAWHSDAILAYARARNRPVAAIVNTHWHLDHSSGNVRIKAVFPNAPVVTTRAIDRALATGGFLARSLESSRPMLDDPSLSDLRNDEIRIFIATMDERDSLRPDVAIERDGEMKIAGRPLDVHVTEGAVTDSDLWLYDAPTGVAIIGDLVTLPAPFFETACPAQWQSELDAVWDTPFRTAIPGHGEPMTRAQFDTYRGAFKAFMSCVNGDGEAATCAAGWAQGIAPLIGKDESAHRMALGYAEYYVGMLRDHGGKSADCRVP